MVINNCLLSTLVCIAGRYRFCILLRITVQVHNSNYTVVLNGKNKIVVGPVISSLACL